MSKSPTRQLATRRQILNKLMSHYCPIFVILLLKRPYNIQIIIYVCLHKYKAHFYCQKMEYPNTPFGLSVHFQVLSSENQNRDCDKDAV